jgi:lipopolysaccharide export system protein LptC
MNHPIAARNDPQTARSYWTMGGGDSARAYRAARRHSRVVRIMRIAIPTAVVVGLTGITLVTYFNPLRLLAKIPINVGDVVVSGTKITMAQPRMTGFTSDARAYEFTADAAAQDMTKPDIVELSNIHGKVAMQDKSTVDMSADAGTYDTKAETLKLVRNILLNSSTGYQARLTEAIVDTKKGDVVSDQPVEVKLLQGMLNANRLEIVNSGELLRFHGGVDMVLTPSNPNAPNANAPNPKTGSQ